MEISAECLRFNIKWLFKKQTHHVCHCLQSAGFRGGGYFHEVCCPGNLLRVMMNWLCVTEKSFPLLRVDKLRGFTKPAFWNRPQINEHKDKKSQTQFLSTCNNSRMLQKSTKYCFYAMTGCDMIFLFILFSLFYV